ncbi:hypothetical protein HYH03_011307 [Edaphochlamys debaryana]|uniref:Uncharacterized protein n=1 Tax=Edaphochlamys debaryana TaxID=47281 RepID=A0A835XW69_9CHLO|nr:hypothetical protein HYH03_011307 [Edaphochlamys debaryana]|eukprot:KAG2490178.1 hypothetical protein HYH03_011307 [Edaphochlamys debaryana]
MAAKRRVEWQQSREERAEKERAAEAARERVEQISHEAVEDWKGLCESLSKTKIRALVLKPDPDDPCRVLLSTKALEPTPGDMLRDPQLVYDRAEEMAAAWRAKRWAAQAVGTQQDGS